MYYSLTFIWTLPLSLSLVLSSERSQLEGRCGNYIVDEEGEECDAGALGLVDKDPCCTADCRLRPTTPDGDTVECRYMPHQWDRRKCSY